MADLKQFDTALCIMPPRHLWPRFDRVRSRYDDDFASWPPHIKLVYPFVSFKELDTHLENISEALENFGPIRLRLGATDHVSSEDGRHEATFLHVDDVDHVDGDGGRTFPLDRLCEAVLEAVPSLERAHWYRSMAVGQSPVGKPVNETQLCLLRAGGLSGIGWEVDELHVLVRTSSISGASSTGRQMTDWASISLKDGGLRIHQKRDTRLRGFVVDNTAVAGRIDVPGIRQFYKDFKPQSPEQHLPFFHNGAEWIQCTSDHLQQRSLPGAQSTLTVASYNVLGRTDDLARLTQNILHTDAAADILVLQETTDILLSQLLQNKDIQERYSFCTHRPVDPKEGDAFPVQNMVVVLGKYAFDWETIPLPVCNTNTAGMPVKSSENEDKTRAHHGALLIELRRRRDSADPWENSTPLAIAALHLTPGLSSGAYLARASEVDAIRQYISWATSAILAGGFNMPTSALTLRYSDFQEDPRHVDRDLLSNDYVDAWMVAKMDSGAETDNDPAVPSFQGEQGFTDEGAFRRALTDGPDHGKLPRRPQRLDKILIKSPGIVTVQSFNKFGKIFKVEEGLSVDENCHLGVRAVLRLEYESNNPDTFYVAERSASTTFRISQGLPNQLSGHESVLEAVRSVHGFPLLIERQLREKAFEALKVALIGASFHHTPPDPEKQKLNLVLLPIGSYALDIWTPSSNLDCLCVGTFSLSTFIDIATQRIQQAADEGIRLIRKIDSSMGTTLEIVFEDRLWINLTYARAPWPLPSSGPTRHLSPDTLKALRAYKDLDYVQRSVPDIVVFRLAHRFIKTWAEIRGIYSEKMGYLSGIQITVLLTRTHKRLVTQAVWPTVPELLFTFFKEYAVFDWEKNVVFDECFHKNLSYSRTSREPLVILSYFPPALNTSLAATTSSVKTIRSEFQQAAKILDQENRTWADLLSVSIPDCPTSGSSAADDFLMCHQRYIKISVQYWGGSTTKGRGFIGWVESRIPSLLADLDMRLKILHFRIWPTRFQENWQDNEAQSDSHTEEGEYQGAFFIGVDVVSKTGESRPGSGKAMVETFKKFAQQIRSDERHFDAAFMAIGFRFQRSLDNFMPRNDLPNGQDVENHQSVRYRLDPRNWDAYTKWDDDFDVDGEERRPKQAITVQSEWSASSKDIKKPATNQPRSAVGPKPQGMGKFRSAADVLNRLRWDASYDQNDFVVGYEDRFLGAMERGLDDWKSEQTHEEFIPQHRILYFKRNIDGVLVWERRTRTDLVFGSC